MRRILSLLLTFVAALAGAAPQTAVRISGAKGEALATAYREGETAFQKRDFAAATAAFKKALATNPGDAMVVHLMAAAQARAGQRGAALESLRALAKLDHPYALQPTSFQALADLPDYKAVAETIAAKARVADSQTAFTLPERDLIPEGIAYDPMRQAFYLGSIYKRKIVSVRPPQAAGEAPLIADFAGEAQDGLDSVLGMKVDVKERILWAASAAGPGMKGAREGDAGRSAVYKYDLTTRRLLKRYAVDGKEPHFLNDLTIGFDGDVFITDTGGGGIYRVLRDSDTLQLWIPPGTFQSPNGIAFAESAGKLFVADSTKGLYSVDRSGRAARLAHPAGVSTAGVDGLYFHRSGLIAVQNGYGTGGIVRFSLDARLEGVTRREVLESGNPLFLQIPTTGVLDGDAFYYIANSQVGSFNTDNSLFPREKLSDVVVLKLPL